MEQFSIERRRTPLADIVRIAGDADLYVAPELERAFSGVADEVPTAAVVDMTALTFLDSTALGQLLAFRRRLEASHVPLLLVCDNRAVLRAFEITALDRRFQIVPTLSEALRSVVEVSPAAARVQGQTLRRSCAARPQASPRTAPPRGTPGSDPGLKV